MREIEGTNEVHKPDRDYNCKAVEIIKNAKTTKNVKDFIDVQRGTKKIGREGLEAIDREKPEFIIEAKKEEIEEER